MYQEQTWLSITKLKTRMFVLFGSGGGIVSTNCTSKINASIACSYNCHNLKINSYYENKYLISN
jgi:hypothetical protein